MNAKKRSFLAIIAWVLLCLSSASDAATVAVTLRSQEKDQWCWAGVSQMVLEFFGTTKTQTEIATFGIQDAVNNWNYLTGTYAATATEPWRKGIDKILENFGSINSTRYNRALTTDELNTEFTANRPAIARLGWYDAHGNPAGGHFVVVKGYDTATAITTVNDPWPDNGVIAKAYNSIVGDAATAGTYTDSSSAHKWTHSLTVAASLDLVFLIDSTGSMYDDIAAVQSAAVTILTNLASKFKDYRVAVVDYRDHNVSPYGETSDWITKVRSVFTTDSTVAKNAINAISAGGGADWPEAVYSALYRVISGDGATLTGSDGKTWRDSPTKHIVIIMGDAPGHSPVEPWSGGKSLDDVISAAISKEVIIYPLLVGGDTDALTDFTSAASGSGGSVISASGATEVASKVTEIVDDVAADVRSPNGEIASLKPTFSFVVSGDGMSNPPSKTFLEIQKCGVADMACSVSSDEGWKSFKRVDVTDTSTWTATKEFPQNLYRWRLGNLYSGGKLTLPESTDEAFTDGKPVKLKGGTRYESEDEFTSFTRTDVTPGDVELVDPSSSFTATETTQTFQWKKASNASKYKLTITWTDSKGNTKVKSKTVKPPKDDPTASVLETTVGGLKVDTTYYWSVTGLNYDHPKEESSSASSAKSAGASSTPHGTNALQ